MKIAGKTPDGGMYVLVDDEVNIDEPREGLMPARVLLADRGILAPPQYFGTLLAQNPYLERYEGEEGELESLMEGVEARGPPADEIGEPDTDTATQEAA
jgi:hypothetical protein